MTSDHCRHRGSAALACRPHPRPMRTVMPPELLSPDVVVSTRSMASDDPVGVVDSNISFVNLLFEDALLREDEMAREALCSYYVDYLHCQVQNGGFAQFVWNSRWRPELNGMVREGLEQMGAAEHVAAF